MMLWRNYNLPSLLQRRSSTLATAVGIAAVVFLFAGVQMFANGLRRAVGRSGRPDVVVFLRKGATSEEASVIDQSDVTVALTQPAILGRADGTRDGVADLVGAVRLTEADASGVSAVRVRGVTADALPFYGVTIVEGRPPRPDSDEAIVGKAIAGRFVGLSLGGMLELPRGRSLQIVGTFSVAGSLLESEVWCGIETARASFLQHRRVSAIRARLVSSDSLPSLQAAIEARPELNLNVTSETDFYRQTSGGFADIIVIVALVVVGFFSAAAIMGLTITMHAAVAKRRRETAMLRALGFSRTAVLGGILFECAAIALASGAVGAAAAAGLQGVRVSFFNPVAHSEMVLSFDLDAGGFIASLLLSVLIGAAGGLFPALSTLRLRPVEALRA